MFKNYYKESVRKEFTSVYETLIKNPNSTFESDKDRLIAKLMKDHPSYFDYWEDDGLDEFEWDEASINPFQHILMHLAAEDLLKNESESKDAVKSFYSKRKRKFMKHHDIIHMLAQIIAMNSYKEMRKDGKFELETFHEDLKKYSTWNKKKFWNTFVPDQDEEEYEEE
jgi:hypothetical protein